MNELSEQEKAAIREQEKELEREAILKFNKKLLVCDTFEEMYRTIMCLKRFLEKRKMEYTLMFPQEWADGQPLSNDARFIAKITCTYEEAVTECEAVSLKYEDRIELYMGKELIGTSNGKGFLNYLENQA